VTSDRLQRQIERLLNEADEAITQRDWSTVRDRAQDALAIDPENAEAKSFLAAANRALGAEADSTVTTPATPPVRPEPLGGPPQPASFANGRYSVTRFLGEGGKKRVYLAHDAQLDRDVAFALIKTEGLDEAARQRITREAQAMGRLGSHPHIVTVYDIGEEDGQPYLVLPVLPGGDVEGVIEDAEDHKLPIEQAVKIATETCLGLEFSHSKGIIHRDLKPGNVWLAEDGRAMIGDFGLAVAVDRSRLTQAGMMVGTVNYMPPEQAMGGEISPRSDLYSLGAMLYEMVCGRPPFVGDESVAIIGQHLNTPPVAPTWHRPDCPPALEALILRLLEKDPEKRPASATEVREALEAVGQSGSQAATSESVRAGLVEARAAADPLYRRVFVGREAELRQLQQAYDAAISGQGGLVMVVGEPGIGKTALCEQLATYVSIRGGRTLVGHCYEEGSLSLPYLAFVEAMRTYVLDRDPDALRTELGTGAADVARIVSEVRDRVDVELRDTTDPEDDRWRLLQAVTAFLRNAANVQPLVIVLEDLHWADRGTLDLLQHVARNLTGARLVLVGTYRDVEVDRAHPLSGAVAELRRSGNFLRIPLRGLTVDEVHRMYEALRGQEVPWGQAELVHRQTEGNPLFVQEVLRYLVEEGIVVREDGRYVARAPGEGVPEGLRDVVGRRLSRLSEKTNEVLSIASVIGRDFTLEVLQRVAGLPEEEVLAALEEATARSVIEQRESPGTVGFRFTHAFFRQTLYEEIFAPRRIRWHQQVGRALEEVYPRRLEEHAAELAEHFAQSTEATDLDKAVRYGELAAQRADSVFAYGEAVRHFQQALRAQEVLDPDDSIRRCRLLLTYSAALSRSGTPGEALGRPLGEGLAMVAGLADSDLTSLAAQVAVETVNAMGAGTTWGTERGRWVSEQLERIVDAGTVGRVWADVAQAHVARYGNRMDESVDFATHARELARSLGDENLVTTADVCWLNVAGRTPRGAAKRVSVADELASVTRAGLPGTTLAQLLAFSMEAYVQAGRRDEAQVLAEELLSEASKLRAPTLEIFARASANWVAVMDGRLEEGAHLQEELERFGEETDLVQLASVMRWRALWPCVLTGRLELLTSAAENGGAFSPNFSLIENLAAIRFALHEDPAAHDFIDFMLQAPISNFSDGVGIYALLGEIGSLTKSEEMAKFLLEALGDTPLAFSSSVNSIVCIPRILGDAHVVLGRTSEARGEFERAADLCIKMRFRPELALTRAHLAELLLDHYPDEHDAAIEHLDFAIAEFRDMKMQPALERALGRRGLLKA
jgi:tetratricopeptide (TPR) repeat protein